MIDGKYIICYCDDIIDNALSSVLFDEYKKDDCDYREVQYVAPLGSEDPIDFFRQEEIKNADVLILDSKLFSDQSSRQHLMGEALRPFLIVDNPFRQIILITANGTEEQFGGIRKCASENSPTFAQQKAFYLEYAVPEIDRSLKIYKSLRVEINKKQLPSTIGEERAKVLRDAIDNLPAYSSWNDNQVDSLIREFKKLEEAIKNHG